MSIVTVSLAEIQQKTELVLFVCEVRWKLHKHFVQLAGRSMLAGSLTAVAYVPALPVPACKRISVRNIPSHWRYACASGMTACMGAHAICHYRLKVRPVGLRDPVKMPATA